MNIDNLDKALSKRLINARKQSPILDGFAVFCAKYIILIIGAVGVLHLAIHAPEGEKTLELMKLALVFAIAWSVTLILEYSIQRPRPYKWFHERTLAKYWTPTPSFPSAHATIAFAFAMEIFLVDQVAGVFLLILALLVALGRVYVGVHYLSDVIAGAIVGSIVSWALQSAL